MCPVVGGTGKPEHNPFGKQSLKQEFKRQIKVHDVYCLPHTIFQRQHEARESNLEVAVSGKAPGRPGGEEILHQGA